MSFAAMVLVSLVSSIVTARIYGIEVIGQFALVMAPVNAVWYLSSVREQAALMRELALLPARAPRVSGLFAAVAAFSSGLTLLVGALAMVGTYFLFAGPINQPELFVPALVNMAGYVVLTNSGWNLDSVLNAFRAARQLFWIRLNQLIVFLAVAVVAGVTRGDVWGLVLATLAAAVTGLGQRVFDVREFMRFRVSRAEVRSGFRALPGLLRFGLKIAPGTVAEGVSNESGTWVLGILSSVAVVGAYNRAWMLSRRLIDGAWRINEMLYPTLVERRARGDAGGFDRVLVDSIRYSAIGMLLPAAAGGGAAIGVMNLFGPGFGQAATALALLLLMPAMFTVSSIQRHALFAVDRPVVTTMSSLARMLITVATCVPLTRAFDEAGMATAILIGLAVEMVYMFVTTRRHLSQPMFAIWPLRQVACLPVSYAAGFLSAHLTYRAVPSTLGTALALAVGAAAYLAAFGVSGGLNSRDWQRLGEGWSLMRKRAGGRRVTPPAEA